MLVYLYMTNYKIMSETLCFAYNDMATINMEEILYHDEYIMYNEDHALDNYIYYQLFECGVLA